MKNLLIAILTGCLSLGTVSAQQKWSLEDCINYAIKNNLTIKTGELTNISQQIKLEQAKNQILPDLNASYSQSQNFGMSLSAKNTYETSNKSTSSASFQLSASLNLFSGFRVKNTIAAQQFSTLASTEELKKAKESMAVNIASAYLQVLYNKELNTIAEEQVALSQKQVAKSEIMASYGKIPEGQVFEAKAQLAKDQYNAIESKGTLQLSLLELAQMLELKEWSNFDIALPNFDINPSSMVIQPAEEVYNYALTHKSNVKASEYQLKSIEKNLEITKSALYPSVDLSAGYSNRYYSEQTNPDLTAATISDQILNNGGSGISLNVRIPIFNRFDTKNNIRLSKIDVEKAKLELENTRKSLYKEIQQAWFNAVKATEKYKSSSEAVMNSEEAFRFAQEKYNNERATIYEFNDANMNLVTAKSNQLQSKYNLLFCIKILDFYKGEPLKL